MCVTTVVVPVRAKSCVWEILRHKLPSMASVWFRVLFVLCLLAILKNSVVSILLLRVEVVLSYAEISASGYSTV